MRIMSVLHGRNTLVENIMSVSLLARLKWRACLCMVFNRRSHKKNKLTLFSICLVPLGLDQSFTVLTPESHLHHEVTSEEALPCLDGLPTLSLPYCFFDCSFINLLVSPTPRHKKQRNWETVLADQRFNLLFIYYYLSVSDIKRYRE